VYALADVIVTFGLRENMLCSVTFTLSLLYWILHKHLSKIVYCEVSSFSALKLLFGRPEEHLACKN